MENIEHNHDVTKDAEGQSRLNDGLGIKHIISPSLYDLIDAVVRISVSLGEERASNFPSRDREKYLTEDLNSATNGLIDFMGQDEEIILLRKAARLIHDRRKMVSGSVEMGDCDEFCKSVGLDVWTWPL